MGPHTCLILDLLPPEAFTVLQYLLELVRLDHEVELFVNCFAPLLQRQICLRFHDRSLSDELHLAHWENVRTLELPGFVSQIVSTVAMLGCSLVHSMVAVMLQPSHRNEIEFSQLPPRHLETLLLLWPDYVSGNSQI